MYIPAGQQEKWKHDLLQQGTEILILTTIDQVVHLPAIQTLLCILCSEQKQNPPGKMNRSTKTFKIEHKFHEWCSFIPSNINSRCKWHGNCKDSPWTINFRLSYCQSLEQQCDCAFFLWASGWRLGALLLTLIRQRYSETRLYHKCTVVKKIFNLERKNKSLGINLELEKTLKRFCFVQTY